MHAYVIHSRSLPEREAWIKAQLKTADLTYEWIQEYEPDHISQCIDEEYFDPKNILSPGQKSCALKHVEAMRRISRGSDLGLILEDDVILCKNFIAKLEILLEEVNNWAQPWVLHLGAGSNFYTPARDIAKGRKIYEGTRVRNMEGYVISPLAALQRIEWIRHNKLREPIDIELNQGDPACRIPFLWAEPPLIEQGSLTGRFKSSLDPKRRSRLQLMVQFPIQKIKRRWLYRWLQNG